MAPQTAHHHRLKAHGIVASRIRVEVLVAFAQAAHSLSQNDLEAAVEHRFDRTSIYRALQLFERRGLVHRVPHTGSVPHFALCEPGDCNEHHHRHHHLHFRCDTCGNTFCLHGQQVPSIAMPTGFAGQLRDVEILARGLCALCLRQG
jgi:Fur family transcriptional regulator, ferric uptake regulator